MIQRYPVTKEYGNLHNIDSSHSLLASFLIPLLEAVVDGVIELSSCLNCLKLLKFSEVDKVQTSVL